VLGKLVEKTGNTIVFQSDRFGVLRVPADQAVVIPAEKPVELAGKHPVLVSAKEAKKAAEKAEAERLTLWEWFPRWY